MKDTIAVNRHYDQDMQMTPGIPLARNPKLAIFGGSFDPVHNGHLFLAGELIRRKLADEVLFVPAAQPPHKVNDEVTPAEMRLEMLNRAIEPYPEFSTSDIEIQRKGELSYTVKTLQTLDGILSDYELHFLMGMDSLVNLHSWHRATELVNRFNFMIYPRANITPPTFATLAEFFGRRNAQKLMDSIIDAISLPIAARDIRELTVSRKSTAGMLPQSVQTYIKENKLYNKRPQAGQ